MRGRGKKRRNKFMRIRLLPAKRSSRLLVIGLIGLLVLVVIVYVEEDWRAKANWEKCRQKMEVKGEILDWRAYVPLAVPDNQNFFKAPKMAEWFAKPSSPTTNELERLLSNPLSTLEITNSADAVNYLAWSDKFEPQFNLIREALKRPFSRLDGDYSMPMNIPLPYFKAIRSVVQTLARRAKCELLLGRSAKALEELTMLQNICHISDAAPTGKPMTLVAAMINAAVVGLYMEAVSDSIKQHAWNDEQLVILQKQLEQIQLPPLVYEALREERLTQLLIVENVTHGKFKLRQFPDGCGFFKLPGFYFRNLIYVSELHNLIISSYNPASSVISSRLVNEFVAKTDQIVGKSNPFRFYAFFVVFIPNYSRAVLTAAYRQTEANEARIVCALERYRIVRGDYPQTLEQLVPRFISALPHDIIGGQPLHYQRTTNENFLLYSVGWNETDDGGKIISKKDGKIDQENSDWVWHYPLKN